MILHLVRHGQSTWNAAGRVPGQAPGVPLTALGRAQAADAAARLAGCGATRLLASDLLRAAQTAEIIAAALGLPVEWTPLLREQARGELEGLRYADLAAEPVPEGVDIADVRWNGGESVADVWARLDPFLDLLGRMPDEQVILVAHADLLRILVARLDGRSHREVDWAPMGHGEVLTREVADLGARRA